MRAAVSLSVGRTEVRIIGMNGGIRSTRRRALGLTWSLALRTVGARIAHDDELVVALDDIGDRCVPGSLAAICHGDRPAGKLLRERGDSSTAAEACTPLRASVRTPELDELAPERRYGRQPGIGSRASGGVALPADSRSREGTAPPAVDDPTWPLRLAFCEVDPGFRALSSAADGLLSEARFGARSRRVSRRVARSSSGTSGPSPWS